MTDAVPHKVEVVQVIKVTAARGDGHSTIVREVVQFWDFDGNLLAENGPYAGGKDIVEGFVDRGIVVRSGERPPKDYVPTGVIPADAKPWEVVQAAWTK